MEFFSTPIELTGTNLMVDSGKEYIASDTFFDEQQINRLHAIFMDDGKCREAMKIMKKIGMEDKLTQVLQIIICNFSELDLVEDIDEHGNLNFEYTNCGFKGNNKKCPFAQDGNPKPFCMVKFKFQK